MVKDAVQQIMERTQVPNTYQLGEVCQIIAKDNPELRGKGGCWGIITMWANLAAPSKPGMVSIRLDCST